LKNILFATKILFVAGPTDKLLIEQVLEKEERFERIDDLRTEMCGMQIISMDGCGSAKLFLRTADTLQIPCKLLLDEDAKNITKKIPIDERNVFIWRRGNLEKMTESAITESNLDQDTKSTLKTKLRNDGKKWFLQLEKEELEHLTKCLSLSIEMKRFFEFLLI